MSGQIADTSKQHISKILTEKGIQVLFQTSVADNKELLKSVLGIAGERANLIIITGGMGPTANDITSEAVSDFFGVPLVPDEEACNRIQQYLWEQRGNLPGGHKKQTLIPEGARVIYHDNGTATGFVLRYRNKEIVCLPGVPGEMQPMLDKYLEISAVQHKSIEGCTLTRNLHTFGISECAVEEALKVFQGKEGRVKVLTLADDGIVSISILATAAERENALKILDRVELDIRNELGHTVFGAGDETLEYAVSVLLKKCNKTIALAESCTGGLVSDKLTNIPGISGFFLEGVVAYSNKAKIDALGVPEDLVLRYGAVSSEVARAMAEGIKKRASAHIGVGITGIAGPAGATKEKPVGLVYIAVTIDDFTDVKEYRFRGSRRDIKKISANTALNMVRLKLVDVS